MHPCKTSFLLSFRPKLKCHLLKRTSLTPSQSSLSSTRGCYHISLFYFHHSTYNLPNVILFINLFFYFFVHLHQQNHKPFNSTDLLSCSLYIPQKILPKFWLNECILVVHGSFVSILPKIYFPSTCPNTHGFHVPVPSVFIIWWDFLIPGKSHGQRSLVGCSPWDREESDTTEQLHFPFSLSCIGEENGNPLQCSCLENPRDGGAWWAAVYGVAQNRTRLKQLSSLAASQYGMRDQR